MSEMTDYINFYEELYKKTSIMEPMLFDCGLLCSRKCCENNGKGMLLFPHEEDYLSLHNHGFEIKDSEIAVSGNKIRILYCTGICSRSLRPVSCRIFPLFPFVDSSGRIFVDFDPRALGTCPLLFTDMQDIYIRGIFRLKVLETAIMLSRDPVILDFLKMMSGELEVIKRFRL
ncbi:MAG: hypothetical protein JXB33_02745 [Clostridia bacterium]|nr:hypothetical protein [Clostridia bacterium]